MHRAELLWMECNGDVPRTKEDRKASTVVVAMTAAKRVAMNLMLLNLLLFLLKMWLIDLLLEVGQLVVV
jgi:hypothetical protein